MPFLAKRATAQGRWRNKIEKKLQISPAPISCSTCAERVLAGCVELPETFLDGWLAGVSRQVIACTKHPPHPAPRLSCGCCRGLSRQRRACPGQPPWRCKGIAGRTPPRPTTTAMPPWLPSFVCALRDPSLAPHGSALDTLRNPAKSRFSPPLRRRGNSPPSAHQPTAARDKK